MVQPWRLSLALVVGALGCGRTSLLLGVPEADAGSPLARAPGSDARDAEGGDSRRDAPGGDALPPDAPSRDAPERDARPRDAASADATGCVAPTIDGGPPPLAAGELVSGQANPYAIATDGEYVYWVTAGAYFGGGKNLEPNDFAGGQLLRCAVSGCGNQPTVLANLDGPLPASLTPSAIAVGRDQVYFGDATGVHACAKAGCSCAPTLVASARAFTALTLSGDTLDFVAGAFFRACRSVPCDGALVLVDPQPLNPGGMASLGGEAYWGDGQRVLGCPTEGCGSAASTIWQYAGRLPEVPVVSAVATLGDQLFWTDSLISPFGAVARCTAARCQATVVPVALGRESPTAIAVDDAGVVWSEPGGIVTCPTAGCGGVAPKVLGPRARTIALRRDAVYVATWGDLYGAADGRILKVAR